MHGLRDTDSIRHRFKQKIIRDLLHGLMCDTKEVAVPISIPPLLLSSNNTTVFKLAVWTVLKDSSPSFPCSCECPWAHSPGQWERRQRSLLVGSKEFHGNGSIASGVFTLPFALCLISSFFLENRPIGWQSYTTDYIIRTYYLAMYKQLWVAYFWTSCNMKKIN